MNDATPPLKQLNRTFIGSVLFIDIVGYSRRTVPDQLEMKELFNGLLADAIQNVATSERIIVDTGDGAGIAFLGDPEDALFAALSLRDAVETDKVNVGEPGFVRMGINLGPLKIVRDINGHTNMIGDGVNDAQRVMSFAEPGHVMVSHSYYDIISRFSRDYTQLFVYEGTRHDKHVREHEVYRFGPVKDNENLTEKLRDRSRARQPVTDMPGAPLPTHQPESAKSVTSPHMPSPVAAAPGKKLPRAGMAAAFVGAATLVGAVWSWTSKPDTAAVAGNGTGTSTGVAASETKTAAVEVTKPPETKSVTKSSGPADRPAPAAQSSIPAGAAAPDATAKTAPTPETEAPVVKPGTVKLAIQPWGEIYVDGGKRGISPPLKSISLPPGKHRIEIRNGDFAPHKETIEIKSGTETTVHYVF